MKRRDFLKAGAGRLLLCGAVGAVMDGDSAAATEDTSTMSTIMRTFSAEDHRHQQPCGQREGAK